MGEESLRTVRVIYPGQSQSEVAVPLTLMVGEAGIISMKRLPDLRVRVYGDRSCFDLWPANVVWAEPLTAPDVVEAVAGPEAPTVVASEPPEAQPTTPNSHVAPVKATRKNRFTKK